MCQVENWFGIVRVNRRLLISMVSDCPARFHRASVPLGLGVGPTCPFGNPA
jgi:hypothetical protein